MLQGGIFCRRKPTRSSRSRMRGDAVDVRLWDDLAKVAGAPTPPLAHFVTVSKPRSARLADRGIASRWS